MLVLLVDDQPLFRHALKVTINQAIKQHGGTLATCHFEECDSLDRIEQVVGSTDFLKENKGNLIWLVSDLQLQGQSLFNKLDEIKRHHPSCKVIIVSAHTHANEVGRAFKLGIDGFIAKQQDSNEIQQAFQEILAGRRAISLPPTEMRSNTLNATTQDSHHYDLSRPENNDGRQAIVAACTQLGLTARETEVLIYLSDGYSNKQIAQQLGITEHTVKVHLTKIFRALRVTSRAQALAYLMRTNNITH